jgi:integrase
MPGAARWWPIADRCRSSRRLSSGTVSRRAGSGRAPRGAVDAGLLRRIRCIIEGNVTGRGRAAGGRPTGDEDALALVDGQRLSEDEALYARAARAANTVKGYRSDWREWIAWCADHGFAALPADPAAISAYLTFLAGHGAKVGTMSRRLSAIRFASRLRDLPDPTEAARVVAVWEGIRRLHGAPPEQASPLMPPELFAVLDACPEMRHWKTKGRQPEPDLAGLRDRVLILIGFVGALRRSELVGLDVDHVAEHPNGLVITLARSKTNQTGEQAELVVLPRGGDPRRCAVTALHTWATAAGLDAGPLLRPVSKGNRALSRRLNPDSANMLVQQAITRAGIDPLPYSAHSLRAGFVTYAHLRGASDRAIAHQTRHRSLATLGRYVRISEAWVDNAATQLGF